MQTRHLTRPCVWALAALAAGLALAGCKDKLADMSSAKHLLSRQHKAWKKVREALKSDKPDLEQIRVVDMFLASRTKRRIKDKYAGPKKAEIMEKLDALNAAYQKRVIPLVNITSPKVVLRPECTIDQLREAFNSMDEDYRAFEEMTKKM